MAGAIEKSMDKKIEEVTRAVPSKTGRVSDADLEKVAGGIEQVLNIGSQSSGAGAGKVTFNPF